MATKLDTTELDKILRKIPGERREILGAAAYEVESGAKQRAPYDTGALYNSIQAEEKSNSLWIVADGVEYGIYWELGFHQMVFGRYQMIAISRKPFMVPAVEATRQMFINKWKDLFK